MTITERAKLGDPPVIETVSPRLPDQLTTVRLRDRPFISLDSSGTRGRRCGALTLLYGGLFLVAGVVLLAITYVLAQANFPIVNQKIIGSPRSTEPSQRALLAARTRPPQRRWSPSCAAPTSTISSWIPASPSPSWWSSQSRSDGSLPDECSNRCGSSPPQPEQISEDNLHERLCLGRTPRRAARPERHD